MSISPEEFRRNADRVFAEKVERLRAAVIKAMQAAYDRGDTQFSVTIPDGVTSHHEDVIMEEYRANRWNVTRDGNRLSFTP